MPHIYTINASEHANTLSQSIQPEYLGFATPLKIQNACLSNPNKHAHPPPNPKAIPQRPQPAHLDFLLRPAQRPRHNPTLDIPHDHRHRHRHIYFFPIGKSDHNYTWTHETREMSPDFTSQWDSCQILSDMYASDDMEFVEAVIEAVEEGKRGWLAILLGELVEWG
ncbi:hypothetical protein BJX70DRAFT_403372 [Aspergillus crustosus]